MRLFYHFTALILFLFAGMTNSLMAQTNGATCDCSDYIYLNDVVGQGKVYKFRVNADGSMTEIGSPGSPWLTG